jgi:hypothetical protein
MTIKALGLRHIATPDTQDIPKTHPIGRRCERPGCRTLLTRYNGGRRCYAHSPSRSDHVTLDEMRSLMEELA